MAENLLIMPSSCLRGAGKALEERESGKQLHDKKLRVIIYREADLRPNQL